MKRLVWLLAAVLAASILSFPVRASEVPTLRVGAGKADITWRPDPDKLRQLVPQAPRDPLTYAGVHTRAWAKAVYVEGPEPFAIVRADLLLVTGDLYEAVAQRVRRDLGIPPERLLVAATHTHVSHSALFPHLVHGALYKSSDPREMAFVADGIAEAVRTAVRNARPALLAAGSGTVDNVSVNRRYTNRELLGARPFGNDPQRIDPELGVLRFDDASTGEPIAVVMNFGVHPVVLISNPLISSDFIGMAERQVEEATDGPMAIWFTGAQGDQDPVYVRYSYPEAEWTARQFAEETVRVAEGLRPEPITDAGIASKLIPLPDGSAEPPSSELGGTPRAYYLAPSSLLIPSYVRLQAIELSTPSGSTALVGWPGEPIRDIGVELKETIRSLGYDRAFVLGLANDWAGYWVTPEEYDRGRYETTFHFYGRDAARYVQHHVIDLARSRLDGSSPEEVALTPKAMVDKAIVETLATANLHTSPFVAGATTSVPDGEAEVLSQPSAVARPAVSELVWRGGSPNVGRGWIPTVEVQRLTEHGFVTVAREGTGDLLLRLATPAPGDNRWSAVWEAKPSTPAGTYRYFVEGRLQTVATDVHYELVSDTFEVSPCACLAAGELVTETAGDGSVSLSVRASYPDVEGGFREAPSTVSTGTALVEAVSGGDVVGTIELPFHSRVEDTPLTVTVHDVSGDDLPVTISDATELGSFAGTWTGASDVTFRLVRVVDAFGNTTP